MLPTLIEHPTNIEHWPILALSTLPLLTVSIYVLYDVHYRTTYGASRGGFDDDDANADAGSQQDYVGVSLTALLYLFLLACPLSPLWLLCISSLLMLLSSPAAPGSFLGFLSSPRALRLFLPASSCSGELLQLVCHDPRQTRKRRPS